MKRFFIQEIKVQNGVCKITGSEARHIHKVLRISQGERFILMDGKGRRFQVLIESSTPKEIKVAIENSLQKPPPCPVKITLCQSILKARAMDFVVQKGSELGVDSISPFTSKRTVIKLSPDGALNKLRHWREIAAGAATQADRPMPARIGSVLSFSQLVEQWSGVHVPKVIFWEEEETRHLKGLLQQSLQSEQFVGVIGPEGGFEAQEVEKAAEAGFLPVSLGRRVLRAETAAVTMVAIVQYEWGDLSRKPS